MGKQQTASASGGQSPAGASAEASAPPGENTARVVMRNNELPGWFWGLLGCLSVLGVGSGVLFLIFKPPGGTAVAGPSLATTPAPIDRAPARRGPQIDIEPMAPPPAPPPEELAAPKPKVAPHPLRIARSPGTPHAADAPSGETDPATAGDSDDAPTPKVKAKAGDSDDAPTPKVKAKAGDSDDAPKPKVKAKAPAADPDDDQAAPARKPPSSDDKSDDKTSL
jgi:hypothetical protein